MNERLLEQLHALCACNGVPNFEEEVRSYILRYASPLAEEAFADPVGNVLVKIRGEKQPVRPIVVFANMDEPGFMVKEITPEGYVHMEAIDGCVDSRTILGKRVQIGRKRVPGIVALKAIHLTPRSERSSVPELENVSIDIGASSQEEAEKLVKPGDTAVPYSPMITVGDCLRGKGLNNRAGCAVALALMEEKLHFDTWFVFGVKSIIHAGFGALLATRRLEQGCSIQLNCICANDLPNISKEKRVVQLRHGAALTLKGSTVYDRTMLRDMMRWATEQQIPWQVVQANRVRDAGQELTAGSSGGKAVSVSIPVRYISSPNPMVCRNDLDAVFQLTRYALGKAGETE